MQDEQATMDLKQFWQQVLGELELQMTRATFDTWLRGSTVVGFEAGVLVIGVKNAYAVAWLQNRLYPMITRTLQGLSPEVADCRFVVVESGAVAPPPPDVASAPPSRVVVELMEFDPTRRGWFKMSNYAVRFWLPYLGGDAFNLWQALCAFAHTVRQGNQWPCIDTLAEIVSGGSRKKLTGRDVKGKHYDGALEILERERIIRVQRLVRNGWYKFQVLEHLPLLTPQQVSLLPERLQEMHAGWVRRCDIDFEEWQQLQIPSLSQVLDGDSEG